MIRSKIQEIFENADKFKFEHGDLLFKDGKNTFVVIVGNEKGVGYISKIRIEIRNISEKSGLLRLNKEEINILSPIFSLVYERRLDEREEEKRKKYYKDNLASIIRNRKKQIELDKLLEKTDFTKENTVNKTDEENNNKEENKESEQK